MKTNYPDSKIKLIKGGGVFNVKYNDKLIYSRQNIEGHRFPNEGEMKYPAASHGVSETDQNTGNLLVANSGVWTRGAITELIKQEIR